jgi:elongation factor P hydroxylase
MKTCQPHLNKPSNVLAATLCAKATQHHAADLVRLFNQCFAPLNTVLVGGASEPLYLPTQHIGGKHQIFFSHDYFASALHEVAHWCVAGSARRLLTDYGYWYCPDGRDATQQAAFEQVEIVPQAIEWAFSVACNKPFRVSTDNLSGQASDTARFLGAVSQQARLYVQSQFPLRAQQFLDVLHDYYQTECLSEADFYV